MVWVNILIFSVVVVVIVDAIREIRNLRRKLNQAENLAQRRGDRASEFFLALQTINDLRDPHRTTPLDLKKAVWLAKDTHTTLAEVQRKAAGLQETLSEVGNNLTEEQAKNEKLTKLNLKMKKVLPRTGTKLKYKRGIVADVKPRMVKGPNGEMVERFFYTLKGGNGEPLGNQQPYTTEPSAWIGVGDLLGPQIINGMARWRKADED